MNVRIRKRSNNCTLLFTVPWASCVQLVSPGSGRCWWLCQAPYTGPSACHNAGCSGAGSSCAIPAAWSHSLLPHQTTGLYSYRYRKKRVASVSHKIQSAASRIMCAAVFFLTMWEIVLCQKTMSLTQWWWIAFQLWDVKLANMFTKQDAEYHWILHRYKFNFYLYIQQRVPLDILLNADNKGSLIRGRFFWWMDCGEQCLHFLTL